MPLYLLSLHTHTPLVITHYFLEAAVWTESDAKLQIFVDFGAEFGRNMLHEVANCQFFCWRCHSDTTNNYMVFLLNNRGIDTIGISLISRGEMPFFMDSKR
jgi:hypothetical protein